MSLKVQADIDLLQAHYDQLELRLNEVEVKQELIRRGINNLLGQNNPKTLKLVQDRMPVPRSKRKE